MSNSPFLSLANDTDWAEAQSHSDEEPILVFKHSNACPVSSKADREMRDLAQEGDLPVYKLVVQKSRTLSDEIADTLGVRHETPQAILIDEQAPAFHTSHFEVTVETLREAARSNAPPTE